MFQKYPKNYFEKKKCKKFHQQNDSKRSETCKKLYGSVTKKTQKKSQLFCLKKKSAKSSISKMIQNALKRAKNYTIMKQNKLKKIRSIFFFLIIKKVQKVPLAKSFKPL